MEVQGLEAEAQGPRPGQAQCAELRCGKSACETSQGCGISAEVAPSTVLGRDRGAGATQVLGSGIYTVLGGRYALHLTDGKATGKQPIDEGTAPRSTTRRERREAERGLFQARLQLPVQTASVSGRSLLVEDSR